MKMFISKKHGLKQAHKRHYKKLYFKKLYYFVKLYFYCKFLFFLSNKEKNIKKNSLKLEEYHRATAKQAYKRVGETQNISTDK